MAIIAEALAVEVLPPDHPAKARLIGIVKQVQVKIKTLFFLFKIKTQSTCYREMLECSRLAWMLSQNLRSWRFAQYLPELLILDLPPSSRDNTSSLNGKNTYYAAYMLEINISSLSRWFSHQIFVTELTLCTWLWWNLSGNWTQMKYAGCIVAVNSLETNKDWHCKLWPRLLLRSRWISKSIGRGKRKGKWRVGEQVGTAVYLAQTPLTPLSLAVPPEGRARALM